MMRARGISRWEQLCRHWLRTWRDRSGCRSRVRSSLSGQVKAWSRKKSEMSGGSCAPVKRGDIAVLKLAGRDEVAIGKIVGCYEHNDGAEPRASAQCGMDSPQSPLRFAASDSRNLRCIDMGAIPMKSELIPRTSVAPLFNSPRMTGATPGFLHFYHFSRLLAR